MNGFSVGTSVSSMAELLELFRYSYETVEDSSVVQLTDWRFDAEVYSSVELAKVGSVVFKYPVNESVMRFCSLVIPVVSPLVCSVGAPTLKSKAEELMAGCVEEGVASSTVNSRGGLM